jgi:hypothetical protein
MTSYDFSSNIDFMLKHTLATDVSNNIELQDKNLNSESFNKTFKYIEDSLNFLYEKNRTLEDLIKYAKSFLQNEINSSISDCKILMQTLEKDRDLVKDKTYIKYSVPFYFGLNNIVDRDSSVINSAIVYDGKLTLADDVLNHYDPTYFSVKRSMVSLYNNEKSYLTNKSYRTLYGSTSIASTPIHETITIKFDKTIKMNKLNITLSNCEIKDIEFTLENNKKYNLNKDNLNSFPTQYVDSISIQVSCSNYSVSQTKYTSVDNNNFSSIINSINTDENLIVDATKYYYYLFGVDSLSAEFVSKYDNSGFISKEIYIGSLNSNEHLTIYADDVFERGSIEYSLINGTEVIPILPENQTKVLDERIFYKSPTRFTVDNTQDIIIKKDGEIINISLYQAINSNDGIYTVSYTPVLNTISSLINESVKVKVIIRTYDVDHPCYVSNIKIKKYGGNELWTV